MIASLQLQKMSCYIYTAFATLLCKHRHKLKIHVEAALQAAWQESVGFCTNFCSHTQCMTAVYVMVNKLCFHVWFSTQEALNALRAAFGQIKDHVSRLLVCVSCSWVSFPDQYCEMKPKDESYFFFSCIPIFRRQYKLLPSPGLFLHKHVAKIILLLSHVSKFVIY